ncbi:MAG: FHA domain-containing protein [Candidatus Brocadiae bacterium]|nr:FHA domain-containing protein [Candidatus Brocadiia bacterium]
MDDLVYLTNPSSGQTWGLNQTQKNIIGRGISKNKEGNLILLSHPTVSKLHAHLWLDEPTQRWYFENISKNGSAINGKDIFGKKVLYNGDKITIGPFELFFCENLLSNEEGTVEVKKTGNFSSPVNSISKAEIVTIFLIFGFALALFYVLIKKMSP